MSESNRQTEWNSNLEQVKTFAANNKRWPSTTSKDVAEKALGQWWSRQKYSLNKKNNEGEAPGLSSEREITLKSFIESRVSFERDGIWSFYYKMVVEKIKADRKLWVYSTTNTEEKKYIRWWNQQKSFARKFKIDPAKAYKGVTQQRYDKIVALMRILGEDLQEPTQTPVTVSVSTTPAVIPASNDTVQL